MAEAGKNAGGHDSTSAQQGAELTPEYLAALVHELRSPLAAARNATELLRSLCGDPRQLQAVEILSRQVVSLTHIADDLLSAAQSQRSALSLRKRAVNFEDDVVESVLRVLRPQIDSRRQNLFVTMPGDSVHMSCDPIRLGQVLQILLANATDQTPEGGTIALKVQHSLEELRIEVSDNGAGVTAEDLASLFNVFALDSPGAKGGPAGLNLAIARNIVEMHGGFIQANSSGVGCGSTFTVRIPLDPSVPTEAISNRARSESRRVLIIEDHEDSAQSLTEIFARAGHSVISAASGELGLELAKGFYPEAVIIDIGLPGIDGFDVARRLRADPSSTNALLIALSGFSLKQFRNIEAYSVFRHYLLKPVSPQVLLQVVERTLEGAVGA